MNTQTIHHSVLTYRVGEYTPEDAAIISRMKLPTLVGYIRAHDADIAVMHSMTLPSLLRKQAE